LTTSRRPTGLVASSLFFGFGALMSLLAALALSHPGGSLEPMWRLNPDAREAFTAMGPWSVGLMLVVSFACLASAAGLWAGALWGYRTASGMLILNLLGDLANAMVRQDLRMLIGLPIGGAMLWYLHRLRGRGHFSRPPAHAGKRIP
jgi:hypothetical protein